MRQDVKREQSNSMMRPARNFAQNMRNLEQAIGYVQLVVVKKKYETENPPKKRQEKGNKVLNLE